MKKLVLVAVVAALLSGCMVNHTPSKPLSEQTDQELCKSVGFAVFHHDGEKVIALEHEFKNREARNALAISLDDCKILVDTGINQAADDQQSNQMMINQMQQTLNRE